MKLFCKCVLGWFHIAGEDSEMASQGHLLEVAMLEENRAPTAPKTIKGARLRMVVFTLLISAGQQLSAYQAIDRQQ